MIGRRRWTAESGIGKTIGEPEDHSGPPAWLRLLAGLNGLGNRDPVFVRDALLGALAAIRDRSAPEPDLVEVFGAVGLATGVAQERIALARGGNHRVAAEPSRDIALHLGFEGMLKPHIG